MVIKSGLCFLILFVLVDVILLNHDFKKRTSRNFFFFNSLQFRLTFLQNISKIWRCILHFWFIWILVMCEGSEKAKKGLVCIWGVVDGLLLRELCQSPIPSQPQGLAEIIHGIQSQMFFLHHYQVSNARHGLPWNGKTRVSTAIELVWTLLGH